MNPSHAFAQLWSQRTKFSSLADLETAMAALEAGMLSPLAASTLRAEVLRLMGQPQEALQHLKLLETEEQPQLSPPDPELEVWVQAYHCLGFLQRWVGAFDAAGAAFIRALELNPEHTPSLNALQYTQLSPGCIAALLPRLQQLQSGRHPGSPLARFLLADWAFQLGETEQSLIWSHQAAKLACKPSQRAALDHLALPSLPEALIVGPPKCGTTSLAGWLGHHDQVFMHPAKELHFFDNRWGRGSAWYRCQFPSFHGDHAPVLRAEATPNYLQHPEIPERVFGLMPEAKIIAIFRHPIERAVSAYHHMRRQEGGNCPDLPAVFEAEIDEINQLSPQELTAYGWHKTNCLFGSLYTLHLQRWQQLFPPSQLLTLKLESVAADPERHWQTILEFLDLPAQRCPMGLPRFNAKPGPEQELDQGLRIKLDNLLADQITWWSSLDCAQHQQHSQSMQYQHNVRKA